MKGDLPSEVFKETTLEANIVSKDGNVYESWNVTAMKCNNDKDDFFIYYLQPVPGCPIVYCAGIFNVFLLDHYLHDLFAPSSSSFYFLFF